MPETRDLRYPIGKFESAAISAPLDRKELLAQLAEIPAQMRAAVAGLSDEQLDTPYRPEGWTVRQLVHHLADAEMHWYLRTKMALTENSPTIQPFEESDWAKLVEARTGPVEPSLRLLEGLQPRWIETFRSLSEDQWERSLNHPERGILVMKSLLPMHVWHGRHHTAHITELRKRMGWG
jgi:uncharacterized damage-inducible protein DinB